MNSKAKVMLSRNLTIAAMAVLILPTELLADDAKEFSHENTKKMLQRFLEVGRHSTGDANEYLKKAQIERGMHAKVQACESYQDAIKNYDDAVASYNEGETLSREGIARIHQEASQRTERARQMANLALSTTRVTAPSLAVSMNKDAPRVELSQQDRSNAMQYQLQIGTFANLSILTTQLRNNALAIRTNLDCDNKKEKPLKTSPNDPLQAKVIQAQVCSILSPKNETSYAEADASVQRNRFRLAENEYMRQVEASADDATKYIKQLNCSPTGPEDIARARHHQLEARRQQLKKLKATAGLSPQTKIAATNCAGYFDAIRLAKNAKDDNIREAYLKMRDELAPHCDITRSSTSSPDSHMTTSDVR